MQITNDFKKDNQMVEVENNEETAAEEFKSDEVLGRNLVILKYLSFS